MKTFTVTILVTYFITSTFSQIINPFSDEGCDVQRSCFRKPTDCNGTSGDTACEMFISWWPTTDGESTNFALFGAAEGYIAVGISRSVGMPDTDVYACTSQSTVKRSYNAAEGKSNAPKELMGVSDISVSIEDSYIKCQFTRLQTLANGDATFFDISGDNEYFSLMSAGNMLAPSGNILFHNVDKESSNEAVSFNKVGNVKVDDTSFKLFKAHGAMMATAWIGFAAPVLDTQGVCTGLVIAHCYEIHRINMLLTFILTCAAFVCIFVAKKGFISLEVAGTTRFVHVQSLVVLLWPLALINVTMAIFSPPRRKYYNWAHRSVGILALTLSAVTMLLGLNINDPFLEKLPPSAFWVSLVLYQFSSWSGFSMKSYPEL
ncbi:putative ferric-chelate reductase 1 isoform X2 [Apostichopus japonicus]|uniref:Putative ferric-chelate reductase 1 isoform X2 n=1 Tax=Stichopus japonicus TaxID=307972 RepID=A0A2G8LD18_STIJA|nr:putative ferric-chelate reductase 1 isoform X2 [Apostichopus japonicus]